MTDLGPLIRIRKFELDEQRRQLGALNNALNEIEARQRQLEEELRAEQEAATGIIFTIGAFARSVIDKRRRLAKSHASILRQIEAKTEEVREAFAELKKFEMAQQAREEEERREIARLERITLDDIGVDAHARRLKEEAADIASDGT